MRIDIHGLNDHNTISDKEYPKSEDASIRLKTEGGSLASKNVRLVIEPSAIKPLFESIAWGSKYRPGIVEQAGILIGNYYRDSTKRDVVIWADVLMVIPADSALVKASFETIDITVDAWKMMYEDAAEFRSENLKIIGWYHTHLDYVNTRFSKLDRLTQRKAFTYEYSFGVVLNPNQKKWSAFYGPESRECIGELLFDDELSVKYGKPQITIRHVYGDSELQEDGSIVHLDNDGNRIHDWLENSSQSLVTEGGTLTLRQLVGQHLIVLGQSMMKPKNREDIQKYEPSVSSHMPQTRKTVPSSQQPSFDSEQAKISIDVPKIEIRDTVPNAPTVKCVLYSLSTDDEFVEHLKLTIKEITIDARLYDSNNLPKDYLPLWGSVWFNGSDLKISLVEYERDANAKISFIRNNGGSEINELVSTRFQKTKIEFEVLIDNTNSQAIKIHVIHDGRREMK